MDLLTAHKSATRQFDTRVRLVRDAQWDNATPCADWTVRDLVGHVVAGQLGVPGLLAGAPASARGKGDDADVLGTDPVAAWTAASAAARDAWTAPGALDRVIDPASGSAAATGYLWQAVLGLSVHAWDLARSIGVDDQLPNDLAAVVLDLVKEHRDELAGSGLFDPPLDTSACADDLTEALALLGRATWKKFIPMSAGTLLSGSTG